MKKKKIKIYWWNGCEKPTRKGVYKRDYGQREGLKWCYWNGKKFGCGAHQKNGAIGMYKTFGVSMAQNLDWAGIIK